MSTSERIIIEHQGSAEMGRAADLTRRKPYSAPLLTRAGSLVELTHGFAGSIPDEQGGHTKRNPFQG